MRFLCICQYGHSRSVAMARVLHGEGHEAVAMGWATAGSALAPLASWADKIIVLDGDHIVGMGCKEKMLRFRIGPDRWSNPYHPELARLCKDYFDKEIK